MIEASDGNKRCKNETQRCKERHQSEVGYWGWGGLGGEGCDGIEQGDREMEDGKKGIRRGRGGRKTEEGW